jgi:hypothetical protein
MMQLAKATDGFHPAVDLFYPFSDFQADIVTFMMGCSAIDCRASNFLSNMGRGGIQKAHPFDEVGAVVSFLGA